MGGGQQPFMYDAARSSSQFPEKEFDPKAVTRASWEPKPRKPKAKGPLVSFNRHPDAHQVPSGRTTQFRPMSGTSKWWIRWTRYLQLVLRSLELVAGLGLVALMILISNVQSTLAWVMRIVPGVVAVSCVYSIWHHARPARARPPASSAAYQLFSAVHDLATAGLYAFGALAVRNQGGEWTTLLSDQDLTASVLVPAEFYALVAAGGLHVASLGIGTYLALAFHRIARMPPDLNPLEDHLTRRARHKRNKSSVATTGSWESTATDSSTTKRISTRLEEHRRSGAPYEDLAARPPSIPFMHTRTGSRDSSSVAPSPTSGSHRDSRADLPSRQYHILPSNAATAAAPAANAKRMSAPPAQKRGHYTEIPLHEPSTASSSRPASVAGAQSLYYNNNSNSNSKPSTPTTGPPRAPRFTETWYASDSLVGRTQERLRAVEKQKQEQQQQQKKKKSGRAYEAIAQRYDDNGPDSDLDSDRENGAGMGPDRRYEQISDYSDNDGEEEGREEEGRRSLYPDPLRAHPPTTTTKQRAKNSGSILAPSPQRPRAKTPFQQSTTALSEVNANARSASGSRDVADESAAYRLSVPKSGGSSKSGGGGWGRNRDSSIQTEDTFYSRPYGELRPATPPVMVTVVGSARQVSSGHDYYDLGSGSVGGGGGGNGSGSGSGGGYGPRSYRRNVSGKVAEEGLAGPNNAAAAANQASGGGGGGGYSRTILKGFMSSMPT